MRISRSRCRGMKRIPILFLQAVIVLIGIVALAVMIRFPLTEGRAVNLDLLSVYADPFIIYGYVASIPFFIALYQAFMLFAYALRNQVFSLNSVNALRVVKQCAMIMGALIVLAALYILMFHHADDDPAGFIAMSVATTFVSIVIATAASVFEGIVRSNLPV